MKKSYSQSVVNWCVVSSNDVKSKLKHQFRVCSSVKDIRCIRQTVERMLIAFGTHVMAHKPFNHSI